MCVSPEDLTRYVGTALTVGGALLVSPGATVRVVEESIAAFKRADDALWGRLTRRFPWLGARNVVGGAGMSSVSAMSGSAWGTVGWAWPSASVKARLDRLEERLSSVSAAQQKARHESSVELRDGLADLRTDLERQIGALQQRLDADEDMQEGLDARALVIVAWGALLGGLAPEIGKTWASAVIVCTVLVALSVWLGTSVVTAWRDYSRRRRASA
jgi:hypothetical protein